MCVCLGTYIQTRTYLSFEILFLAGKCKLIELSERRVQSVKFLLHTEGVRSTLEAHGWGCSHTELRASALVRIFPKKHHDLKGVHTLGRVKLASIKLRDLLESKAQQRRQKRAQRLQDLAKRAQRLQDLAKAYS